MSPCAWGMGLTAAPSWLLPVARALPFRLNALPGLAATWAASSSARAMARPWARCACMAARAAASTMAGMAAWRRGEACSDVWMLRPRCQGSKPCATLQKHEWRVGQVQSTTWVSECIVK